MSQAANPDTILSRVLHDRRLTPGNITLAGLSPNALVGGLFAIGIVGLALTIVGSQVVSVKHALAAYHTAVMATLGICLGSLFWVMLFHILNAKWPITIRRQMEHVMRAMWVIMILFFPILIIEILAGGLLFKWMNPEVTANDAIYEHKQAYLNTPFFVLRAVVYFGIWLALIAKFWGWQREQDETGDRWISAKARFTSAYGLILFALATAFAGFDWLMSLDFHFFSTMWGVYFFAGAAYSAMALNILITSVLRGMGKLEGLVTDEHLHDQGKLLFAFTCFWAYIAFSQYFLIWYSNIPEETRYMDFRQENFPIATAVLVVGHFVLPFVFLLPRPLKRRAPYVAAFAGAALAIHMLDIWWIIRPMADAAKMKDAVIAGTEIPPPKGIKAAWVDLAAIVGVLGIFLAVVVRNIFSGNLVPVNDPRLGECLHHKNYV
ncbi:MAG: hypothetical protein AAFR96_00515 [Planctomycetota bacterium]